MARGGKFATNQGGLRTWPFSREIDIEDSLENKCYRGQLRVNERYHDKSTGTRKQRAAIHLDTGSVIELAGDRQLQLEMSARDLAETQPESIEYYEAFGMFLSTQRQVLDEVARQFEESGVIFARPK